jgi:hypothetical protein
LRKQALELVFLEGPLVAHLRSAGMSALRSQSGAKRTEAGDQDRSRFCCQGGEKKFKVDFKRVLCGENAMVFKTLDLAMEAKFKEKIKGVFVFGFEGLDSYFTVARSVAVKRVALFDSWQYGYLERDLFVWGAPKRSKSENVLVNPQEFDWITIG